MQISIIGTGGVGGYFGARLAAAGNDVCFVARGKHKEALEENGLRLKSIKGDLFLPKVKVVEKISELDNPELVIVAVKSWQVKTVAAEIARIISDRSLVLPLQNGVLSVEEILEFIPREQVLGALCRIFSMIGKPGEILHKGVEPTIIFGELNIVVCERTKELSNTFTKAGIHHRIAKDVEAERWKKFISICLSGLMAVSRTTYGELRSIPEMRKMMLQLMNEVKAVADAKGVRVGDDYIEKAAAIIETFRFEATASLTRDVWAGRPSEIEYQNGTVLRLAEKYGVDVPLNRFVYYSILPGEMKARNQA